MSTGNNIASTYPLTTAANFDSSDQSLLPHDIQHSVAQKWFKHNVIKCFHLNVRSIGNKRNDFQILLDSFGFTFDAVMISETWLDGDDSFQVPHYKTFAVSRVGRRGGGVCILINERIESEAIQEFCLCSTDVEVVSIIAGNNTILSTFYRPPSGDICAFLEFFKSYLTFLVMHKYDAIISGDFNIDMLTSSSNSVSFDVLLRSYGLTITTKTPTRITPTSETLLDLFITNIDESNGHSAVTCCDLSDHLGICLFCQKAVPKQVSRTKELYQPVTTGALDRFRVVISNTDWSRIHKESDANTAYQLFLDTFCIIYEKHFPFKEKKNP
ncbi:uncharacterized protein LOC125941404 [Dermacentor silvarum]|uniref:uncharacterized protein LOC125941404 n=1 Tax=Dermacentor silvarum TaxID=543639 RepID=UPI002100CB0A|nr:uncharacterized protein LOC125941404 [Dermacentor silvarum]